MKTFSLKLDNHMFIKAWQIIITKTTETPNFEKKIDKMLTPTFTNISNSVLRFSFNTSS